MAKIDKVEFYQNYLEYMDSFEMDTLETIEGMTVCSIEELEELDSITRKGTYTVEEALELLNSTEVTLSGSNLLLLEEAFLRLAAD